MAALAQIAAAADEAALRDAEVALWKEGHGLVALSRDLSGSAAGVQCVRSHGQ